ncbi:MAG: ABC transporter permease [Bacillaceae bacterium]
MLKHLFFHRLQANLLHSWRTVSLFFDGMIWVYIGIPILALFVYQYVLLWQQKVTWISGIEQMLFFAIVLFFFLIGELSMFIEEADCIYLIDKKKGFNQLKKDSSLYQFVKIIILFLFSFSLTLPILLLELDMSLIASIEIWLHILCINILYKLSVYRIEISNQHWFFKGLYRYGMLIAGMGITFFLFLNLESSHFFFFVYGIFIAVLLRAIFHYPNIMKEIHYSAKVQMSFSKAVLQSTGTVEAVNDKTKPFFYLNWLPIISVTTRLIIVSYIRNKSRRRILVMLGFAVVNGVILTPFFIKILCVAFGVYALYEQYKQTSEEITQHDFYKIMK